MVKRDKKKFNQYMREYRQKHLEEIRRQDRVRCAKRRETEEYKDYHKNYSFEHNKTEQTQDPHFIICPECGEVRRYAIGRILTHLTNGMCRKCYYKSLKGKEPWNKGMRTRPIAERPYRESRWGVDYAEWHNECLRRDWYHCQICESKERLEVHHVKAYKDYPQERLNLDNGITLCKKCHLEVHNLNVLAQQ
jgi:5-methylcytosine-specific restriction endonuclease McrA